MASPRPEDVASLLRASARDGVWLPVDGGSMFPTISAGSEVLVEGRDRRPRIAEIWAFCDANGLIVVHRYRRRETTGRFVFRGDNVVRADEAVDPKRLIGVVRRVRRDGAERDFGLRERLRWLAGRGSARTRARIPRNGPGRP
jgi:hypothetical protein